MEWKPNINAEIRRIKDNLDILRKIQEEIKTEGWKLYLDPESVLEYLEKEINQKEMKLLLLGVNPYIPEEDLQ